MLTKSSAEELTTWDRLKMKLKIGFMYFTDIGLPLFDEGSDLFSAGRYFWYVFEKENENSSFF